MNLTEEFLRRFEIVHADTSSLKSEVFRLRHEVYCNELNFEPRSDDLQEVDRWDKNAYHFLIRHIESGEFIGCSRLVCDTTMPYPIEYAGVECSHWRLQNGAAEVSRVMVLKEWRRRKNEEGNAIPSEETVFESGRFPYIALGLYLSIVKCAEDLSIRHLLLLCEKKLLRQIAMMGFENTIFDEPVEYKGTRYPSVVDVSRLRSTLKPEIIELLNIVGQKFDIKRKIAA